MATRTKQILDSCKPFRERSETIVLATIIETLGSSYQKAGARMLITASGELYGLLGGGCVEGDLKEKAGTVFRDGQAKLVFYDMRAPAYAIWGLGLGCNGAVRILLQRLSGADDYRPLSLIENVTSQRKTGVLVTVYESTDPVWQPGTCFMLDCEQSDTAIAQNSPAFFAGAARMALLADKPLTRTHQYDGHELKAFYDIIKPPSHLLVIGAGPDAVPVVQLAKDLGWRVTIVDHRPAWTTPERFPCADQLLHCYPEELAGSVALDQVHAMVLMTHNIEYDERYLKVIAAGNIPYVGLLGPAARRDRLLDSLAEMAGRIQGRVFGPAGLDIGAETPEEIALAIMAEIQAVMHRRDGGQLYNNPRPLHDRETPE